MDQKSTRLKICKFQRIYFEVYIKLDDEQELFRLFEYFLRSQSLHLPSLKTHEIELNEASNESNKKG